MFGDRAIEPSGHTIKIIDRDLIGKGEGGEHIRQSRRISGRVAASVPGSGFPFRAVGNMHGVEGSADQARPACYDAQQAEALPAAGVEHLRSVLSAQQPALYRVVTRDARTRQALSEETTGTRDARFAGYVDLWAKRAGWSG